MEKQYKWNEEKQNEKKRRRKKLKSGRDTVKETERLKWRIIQRKHEKEKEV